MTCDGGTHYAGCACHESAWAEKLAAAEARIEQMFRDRNDSAAAWAKVCGGMRDRAVAAEERARRLEEALQSFVDVCDFAPPVLFVDRIGKACSVARAALAPPPEAEKRGEE